VLNIQKDSCQTNNKKWLKNQGKTKKAVKSWTRISLQIDCIKMKRHQSTTIRWAMDSGVPRIEEYYNFDLRFLTAHLIYNLYMYFLPPI